MADLAFLWHMHQPDYRDHVSGEFHRPWTYLHALKDYTDMAAHLERHPRVRAVVNFAAESHVDRSITGPATMAGNLVVGNAEVISGLALNLAGPQMLKLVFHAFVVLVGGLILSGAVNTSIIGANGVLNRVAEDSAWSGEIDVKVRVEQYELRPDSGGAGRHRGGSGLVRKVDAAAIRSAAHSTRSQIWNMIFPSPGCSPAERWS